MIDVEVSLRIKRSWIVLYRKQTIVRVALKQMYFNNPIKKFKIRVQVWTSNLFCGGAEAPRVLSRRNARLVMRDLVVVFTVLVNLPGCSNPFSFFGVVKFSSSQVYPGFEVQSAGDVALTPGAARGDFFTKNQNYRLGGGEVGRFDVRTERLGIHILRAEGSEYDFRLTLGLDNREAEPISLNLSSVKLYSLVAATGSKDEAARPCHFVFQKEHGLGTIMLFAEKPSTEWSLRAASETGAGNDTYTAVTPEGEWEVFRDSSDKNLSILAKERAVLDIQVCGRFSKLVKGTLALECIGRGLIKYEFYMEARK